eukprot:1161443-Amphidinium_carterae.1
MCCALAFSKGRCSATPLLGQCRRKAAFCLAANHNWADSASRRFLTASDLRREAQIKALRKWHGSKLVNGESGAKPQEEVCASEFGEKQGNKGAEPSQCGDVFEPDTKAWAARADIDDQELVLVNGMLEGRCSSMAEAFHEDPWDSKSTGEEETEECFESGALDLPGGSNTDGSDQSELQEHLHELCGFRQAGGPGFEDGRRVGQGGLLVHGEDVRGWGDRGPGWSAHRCDEVPLPDSFRQGEEGYTSHGAVSEGVPKSLPSSFQTTSALGSGHRSRGRDAWNGPPRLSLSVANLVQYLCQARDCAWAPGGGRSSARGDKGIETGVHPHVSAGARRDFQDRDYGRHDLCGRFRFSAGPFPQAEDHGQEQQGQTLPSHPDS